jgi:AcrR family transcriptional regulator
MKTADRILLVSLELFNQHGEANVSSVDIAMELDISPGNLYYHFKGKEIILSSLFDMYQSRMTNILKAPENASLSLEEFFYYLLLLFQASHDFRFLYRNPAEMTEKYPQIAKGFRRILTLKEKIFSQCISNFHAQGQIIGDDNQQQQIVRLIGLIGTQTPNYQLLKGNDINDGVYVYQSLSTILFSLAPYMNMTKESFDLLHQTITRLQLEE